MEPPKESPDLELSICQLCAKKPTGEKSHIIPRLVSKAIARECGGHRLRSTENPNKIEQDTLKIHFLCKNCEDAFEKHETAFAIKLKEYLKNPNSDLQITEHTYRLLLSSVWRAAKFMALTNPPEQVSHLVLPEFNWREYLLSKRSDVAKFSLYLFREKDLKDDEIKSARALTHTILRYSIGFGVNGFYEKGFTRQAVMVKLGPLVVCGLMRDLENSNTTEVEQWEKFKITPGLNIYHPSRDLPKSVIAGIDSFIAWSTVSIENKMSNTQKTKQKEHASKTLHKTIANQFFKKDLELFNKQDS